MVERTTTGLGNKVSYAGMDAVDERTRRAVESARGRRIDWSQAYTNYAEAAKHTSYASANKLPLFPEARPVAVQRNLRIEQLATALTDGTARNKLIEMVDEDVLRRTGVDIRGKFLRER